VRDVDAPDVAAGEFVGLDEFELQSLGELAEFAQSSARTSKDRTGRLLRNRRSGSRETNSATSLSRTQKAAQPSGFPRPVETAGIEPASAIAYERLLRAYPAL